LNGRLVRCLDAFELGLMLGDKAIEDLDDGPNADCGDRPDCAVLG
jgi:hypothetical protein